MARNPLLIVEEYLASEDTRIRQNAICALVAFDTDESLDKLLDSTLRRLDSCVRLSPTMARFHGSITKTTNWRELNCPVAW